MVGMPALPSQTPTGKTKIDQDKQSKRDADPNPSDTIALENVTAMRVWKYVAGCIGCVFVGTTISLAMGQQAKCYQQWPQVWPYVYPQVFFPDGFFRPTECGYSHVHSITLTQEGSGILPEGVCDFTSVTKLSAPSLHYNGLPGCIFTDMTSLLELDVRDNLISSLPSTIQYSDANVRFDGNPCLLSLSMTSQGLHNFSKAFLSFAHLLVSLDVSNNSIAGFPMDYKFTNLQHLNLSSNLITSFEIDALAGSDLITLDISHNAIPFLDNTFASLLYWANLELLDISFNHLDTVPQSFQDFEVVRPNARLLLHGNPIQLVNFYSFPHANIPTWVLGLEQLAVLDLGYASITSFPDEFSQLAALEYLLLKGCNGGLDLAPLQGMGITLLDMYNVPTPVFNQDVLCTLASLETLIVNKLHLGDFSHCLPIHSNLTAIYYAMRPDPERGDVCVSFLDSSEEEAWISSVVLPVVQSGTRVEMRRNLENCTYNASLDTVRAAVTEHTNLTSRSDGIGWRCDIDLELETSPNGLDLSEASADVSGSISMYWDWEYEETRRPNMQDCSWVLRGPPNSTWTITILKLQLGADMIVTSTNSLALHSGLSPNTDLFSIEDPWYNVSAGVTESNWLYWDCELYAPLSFETMASKVHLDVQTFIRPWFLFDSFFTINYTMHVN